MKLSILYAESQLNACIFSEQHSPTLLNSPKSQDRTLSVLTRCLESCKNFLEIFLSLPVPEYLNVSFIQWAQLVQVLKIAPQLCFSADSMPQWDADKARKELRLELILESLCYRMHELTSTSHSNSHQDEHVHSSADGHSRPDHFLMFKSVLKILKETYEERCAAAEQQMMDPPRHASRCPVMNGSIKDSEFWDALQASNAAGTESSDSISAFDFGEMIDDWNWTVDGQLDFLGQYSPAT